MGLQTMGSSVLARSNPGSALRSKEEKRVAASTNAQAPTAAPGTATRSLVEEPLKSQVPFGTEKVLSVKPTLDKNTNVPSELLDMGSKAQAMAAASPTAPSAMTPEIQAATTGLNLGTRRSADSLAPKPVTGGKPLSSSGGPAPGADLTLSEQSLSKFLPTAVEGAPIQYKTSRGEVLGATDKVGSLNNQEITQIGANGEFTDAPGELRSFAQNVTKNLQPTMRSVEQVVQNLPGASIQSKANPFTLNLLGSRVMADEGIRTNLFDPNLLQAITRSVGSAIQNIPALRSAGENLQSFANNNLRSDDYGIMKNLNAAAAGQPLPIASNPTVRSMASNVNAAASNLRSKATQTANNVSNTLRSAAQPIVQKAAPVVQKAQQTVNNVVNSIKNFLGGLFGRK